MDKNLLLIFLDASERILLAVVSKEIFFYEKMTKMQTKLKNNMINQRIGIDRKREIWKDSSFH